jgi:K+-sensing histidine kinase KdpD
LFEFTKETADDNTKGIGLGLTICDSIIKKLDGTLQVESKKG